MKYYLIFPTFLLVFMFACSRHIDVSLKSSSNDNTTQNVASSFSGPQLVVGLQHTCFLNSSQEVKCWGLNSNGQLGYDDTTTRTSVSTLTAVQLGQKALQISAGFYHTCALLEDGNVKCWGRNSSGQLGYDDTTNRGNSSGSMASLQNVNLGKTAKKIAVGSSTSCAILSDDTLKCWGYNGNGELGQDDTNNRGIASFPMSTVNSINLGQTVKDVSVGGDHVCAILADDSLKCWGRNLSGELGYEDNTARGKTTGSMAALVAVNLGQTVKKVNTFNRHTCVVLADNTAKCWGANWEGALGQDHANDIGTSAGSITGLAAINLGQTVKSIQTGYEHTCAILQDDSLKCFGYNWDGALGIETNTDMGSTTGSMATLPAVSLGTTVKSVSLGEQHTCALLTNNKIKCWGYNDDGRLGYGDTTVRGKTSGSMSLATELSL